MKKISKKKLPNFNEKNRWPFQIYLLVFYFIQITQLENPVIVLITTLLKAKNTFFLKNTLIFFF